MGHVYTIIGLVLGNIIGVAMINAAMTGAEKVWMYLVLAALDVAVVYGAFRAGGRG